MLTDLQANGHTVERIARVKLILELQKFTDDANIDELLDREKYVHLYFNISVAHDLREIMDILQKDAAAIPATLLQKIIKLILPMDYIKAVQYAEELGDIFAFGNWTECMFPIAKTLLSPTIYEPGN